MQTVTDSKGARCARSAFVDKSSACILAVETPCPTGTATTTSHSILSFTQGELVFIIVDAFLVADRVEKCK